MKSRRRWAIRAWGTWAAEYDHERTLFLNATGIQVIRFENKTVFDQPEWVLEQIRTAVNKS